MRSIVDRLPWLMVALSTIAFVGFVFFEVRQDPNWDEGLGAGIFYGFCPFVLFIAPVAYALGLLVQRLIRGKSEAQITAEEEADH